MSKTIDCLHVTLVESGMARVQSCTECGCISVHLGPTTLRFDSEGLEALWWLIGEAVTSLRERRAATVHTSRTRGLA